jgi:hypothetical protein
MVASSKITTTAKEIPQWFRPVKKWSGGAKGNEVQVFKWSGLLFLAAMAFAWSSFGPGDKKCHRQNVYGINDLHTQAGMEEPSSIGYDEL